MLNDLPRFYPDQAIAEVQALPHWEQTIETSRQIAPIQEVVEYTLVYQSAYPRLQYYIPHSNSRVA